MKYLHLFSNELELQLKVLANKFELIENENKKVNDKKKSYEI